MKLLICFIALFFILSEAQSQMPWSDPIQLTTGNSDDLHPSMVVSEPFSFFLQAEWLTFSRGATGSSSRNICLMRSSPFAQTWQDTLHQITEDSAQNDFPCAARISVGDAEMIMVVWQRSVSGTSQIWSRFYADSALGEPLFIGEGTMPVVTPADSGFAAVWVNENAVMFSSFYDNEWSPPEEVAIEGDLTVSFPQIRRLTFARPDRWLVVWQQEKGFVPDSEIRYSIRKDTGWTAAGIVTSEGDNRHPKFHKVDIPGSASISWESNWTGDWETYTLGGQNYPQGFQWEFFPMNASNNPSGDDNNPAFEITPIITQQGNILSYYTAACWLTTSETGDSIALRALDDWYTQYRAISPGTTDRNPDVSSGVLSYLGLRVWVVWESNASGHWKLYGVSKEIALDIEEDQTAPDQFSLSQNYPNPFNPNTTISFIAPHSSFITLKVYNVLGQEVQTLVNDKMEAGEHNVAFNAAGLPSGVYIYRIQAGEYSTSRKMVLIK